jgi:hypothetical protein
VSLAFHPEHLNAGGVCKVTYSASGSLKNHGSGIVAGVDISHQVISGASWVDHVEVMPSNWEELGTSKPARFTVYVHTNETWPAAGKGAVIVVRLHAGGGAQAIFTVRNQCKPEQQNKPDKLDRPDKPGKPDKPDKPDKSKEPKKHKKSFYDPGTSSWVSALSQIEV